MIRIIVFSDTHKCIEPCIQAVTNIKDNDMIIHAGDHWSDARELEDIVLSVMKNELRAVVNLGALIGAIIGVINVFI